MTQGSIDKNLLQEASLKTLTADKLPELIALQNKKIEELEELVQTISRGKYMWESTFDAITSPVIIVSDDYVIRRANRAAALSAHVDVRQMVGTKCYETLAGATKPCGHCPLRETLQTTRPALASLDPFPVGRQYDVHAYPLETDVGQTQVVMHYRDVTEERELQRQLLQSEKLAAIGTLAGGIAHEINNPLGGILAFAQLVMRDLGTEHGCFNDLKEIEEAALRCKKIVQDLLDFSRQNRDEVMTGVNLNDVVNRIMPLIRVQAKSTRMDMEFDLAESLPLIRGHFSKLQQVYLNLVTNAFQAMKNSGKVIVRTYPSEDGQHVISEVSDNGPGVAKQYVSKIFDPYFTTKKQGEGTGLGLSITYGIVQEHEGTISVVSEEGHGATFIITYPVYKQKTKEKL
ncbi:PAS domain-containing protein [bacterium]|nr:PAS domain-containing protein [bacterium]